jgi:osmotically-inducible protein OsmY
MRAGEFGRRGGVTMSAWANRRAAAAALAAAAGFAAWLGACNAAQAGEPAPDPSRKAEARPLDTVVVTAQRLLDEQLRTEVERALRNDPTLMSDHLDVSIKNGVVTLTGLVFDDWDMRIARRAAKRIAGVKRVINDMEIKLGGE